MSPMQLEALSAKAHSQEAPARTPVARSLFPANQAPSGASTSSAGVQTPDAAEEERPAVASSVPERPGAQQQQRRSLGAAPPSGRTSTPAQPSPRSLVDGGSASSLGVYGSAASSPQSSAVPSPSSRAPSFPTPPSQRTVPLSALSGDSTPFGSPLNTSPPERPPPPPPGEAAALYGPGYSSPARAEAQAWLMRSS